MVQEKVEEMILRGEALNTTEFGADELAQEIAIERGFYADQSPPILWLLLVYRRSVPNWPALLNGIVAQLPKSSASRKPIIAQLKRWAARP